MPPPNADITGDLKMLVSQTESNKYFGKMLIGRIHSGKISVGDKLQSVDQSATALE